MAWHGILYFLDCWSNCIATDCIFRSGMENILINYISLCCTCCIVSLVSLPIFSGMANIVIDHLRNRSFSFEVALWHVRQTKGKYIDTCSFARSAIMVVKVYQSLEFCNNI